MLAVFVFTGFFAFATFLFSPFESDYPYDVASLVPRDVDVYISKAELARDFEPFPEPVFAANLLASKSGQALARTVLYRDLLQRIDVSDEVDEIRAQLAQLPLEVELLDLFGGEDVVVGAYLTGGTFETAEWVVAGRIDWKAKLGVALLGHPGLLGLDAQGITVEELEEGGLTLRGGQLTQPISLWRTGDVLVVSNQTKLVQRAQELEANRGQNSFLQSARYADQIQFKGRAGNELELFVDWPAFTRAAKIPTNVPNPNSDEFVSAYFGKLLALHSVRELAGSIAFDRGVTLRLNGPISSEVLTTVQKRIHHRRGVPVERVHEMARMAPLDTGLFAVLGGSIEDLLEQALLSIEPSARQLVDDAARSVWGYPNATPLLSDVAAALGSRLALIVRNHDYPAKPGDPPNDGAKVPAWCLVFAVADQSKVEGIQQKIVHNAGQFGFVGDERGSVFTHPDAQTGVDVTEFWSPFVPGTGHLASLVMGGSGQGGTYLLVGNHYQLVQDCLRHYYTRANTQDLASKVNFKTVLNAGLGAASLYLWAEPAMIEATSRALAGQLARDTVQIDWSIERPRLERRILQEEYGEAMAVRYPTDLPAEVQLRLDELYGAAAGAFEREFHAAHTPDFENRYSNTIEALGVVDSLLIQVLLQDKKFDLYLRALLAPDTLGS